MLDISLFCLHYIDNFSECMGLYYPYRIELIRCHWDIRRVNVFFHCAK